MPTHRERLRVANFEPCQVRARPEVVEDVARKAGLTGIANPDILRRPLLPDSGPSSIEQSRTTISDLEAREKDLEAKASNLLGLVEEARSPAVREAYETGIDGRTA